MRDDEAADDDGEQQYDNEEAADEAQLLTADAEDEVRLPLWKAPLSG